MEKERPLDPEFGYGSIQLTTKRPKHGIPNWITSISDFCLAFTVFPMGVVLVWRSIWQIIDVALTNLPQDANIDDHPQEKWETVWKSLPICLPLSFFVGLGQFHASRALQRWYHSAEASKARDILLALILRLAIAFMTLVGVCCWRAIWDLLDVLLNQLVELGVHFNFKVALLSYITIQTFVICSWPLRISRSLLSSPLQVSYDGNIKEVLESPTMLDKRPPGLGPNLNSTKSTWPLFIFDTFASTVLVQFLVVTCWWALWTFLDQFLGGTLDVMWIYLAVGYSCCICAYALQYFVKYLRMPKIYIDVVIFIGYFGTVTMWRGLWDGSDIILSPLLNIENRMYNLMVQCMIGYAALAVTNSTSLASSRGVLQDDPPEPDLPLTIDHTTVCIERRQVEHFLYEEQRLLA